MNNRPEQWDWPEPVQDELSPEDLTMIVWEMKKDPNYEADRARRMAKMKNLCAYFREHATVLPKADEPDEEEPVQEEISPEDLAMIVQEMKKESDYDTNRARRIAAINEYRDYLLSFGPIPNDRFKLMRGDDNPDDEDSKE